MQSTAQVKSRTLPPPARPDPATELPKPAPAKQPEYNPYLAARSEWDDRNGASLSRAKQSERIALICAGIALLFTLAFVVMALRPQKVIVIAVNSKGEYLGTGASDQTIAVTEDMKRSVLSEWVANLRMVTPDGISQRAAVEKVYDMISSGSPAEAMVSDFYRAAPPQTRVQTQTVHVEVNSVLTISEHTYQVEWVEVTRDLQGRFLLEQPWKGAFTFVISSAPRTDERAARFNPIGLYVTQASWSKVL
jgi:type IV secretion system protein VirB5